MKKKRHLSLSGAFTKAAKAAGILAKKADVAAAIKKFAGGTTPNNVLAILALSVKETSQQHFARHDDFLRYDRKKKTKHEYEVITYTYKSFEVTVKTPKHYFSVQVGYEEPTKMIQLKVVDTLQEPWNYVRPSPLVWKRTLDDDAFESFKERHAAFDRTGTATIQKIKDDFRVYFVNMEEEKSVLTTNKRADEFIMPRVIALEQTTMSSFTDNCVA